MPGLRFSGSSRLREPPRGIILCNCNRQSTLEDTVRTGKDEPGDQPRRKGGGGAGEAGGKGSEVCQELAGERGSEFRTRGAAKAGAVSPGLASPPVG